MRHVPRREDVFDALWQPKSIRQLGSNTHLDDVHVHRSINELKSKNLIVTITPERRLAKLYTLTPLGKFIRTIYFPDSTPWIADPDFARIDWRLYSECCEQENQLVLTVLHSEMQVRQVRSLIMQVSPPRTLSTYGLGTILMRLCVLGLVTRRRLNKQPAHYSPTELGQEYRQLLLNAM